MPHHFIFNRDWFEHGGGRPQFEEFSAQFGRLTEDERSELVSLLSSVDPRHFHTLDDAANATAVKRILSFYVPMDKEDEASIWKNARSAPEVADEERVEDAGLNDDSEPVGQSDALKYVEISA